MQAWCTAASISSVVIPGQMCDAAMSRTSRASYEMNGIRLAGTFEISHMLTPGLQKWDMHLLYKRFSSFAAPPDSICEEAVRHASFPRQEFLKDDWYQYAGTSLRKAWLKNHLRRNQAGVYDQVRLLWEKEDRQDAEGRRSQS